MSNVILNEAQRAAVSWYFNPENKSGDVWPLDEPVNIEVKNDRLIINHNYLDLDGEWCTPQAAPVNSSNPKESK